MSVLNLPHTECRTFPNVQCAQNPKQSQGAARAPLPQQVQQYQNGQDVQSLEDMQKARHVRHVQMIEHVSDAVRAPGGANQRFEHIRMLDTLTLSPIECRTFQIVQNLHKMAGGRFASPNTKT